MPGNDAGAGAPALLLVGHGSRSARGVAAYWQFADVVQAAAPELLLGCGFIELAEPDLATAIEQLVDAGATSVIAVPLVLLGAGHMKNDGPAGPRRRPPAPPRRGLRLRPGARHPPRPPRRGGRTRSAPRPTGWPAGATAVVLVSRGSSDPDANADLFKVGRLLWDRHPAEWVEAAFVSLAPPSVADALERCRRLGAVRIAVVPYFLFTGVLVERIGTQAAAWAAAHPGTEVRTGAELGPDPRLAGLVLERYQEAVDGDVRMNCDGCAYRVALPGYEHRVGALPLIIEPEPHRHLTATLKVTTPRGRVMRQARWTYASRGARPGAGGRRSRRRGRSNGGGKTFEPGRLASAGPTRSAPPRPMSPSTAWPNLLPGATPAQVVAYTQQVLTAVAPAISNWRR